MGIGIHTGNARRGYEIGCEVRRRGAYAVFGGIHATLFPEEVLELGGAHAVVRGDGDLIWPRVVADCLAGRQLRLYEGGRIDGDQFVSARWDLLPARRYMFGSVQTVRGCPKHCSFCSVWRTDGQEPRQRAADRIVREVVELRRLGFRFIVLADDNFYPVTFDDLAQARRRADPSRLRELEALRDERFELMARLAELPDDLVFYTQITMEAAEDPAFLDAMKRARILGALVGVESVTRDGLKDVYKGFNLSGEDLIARLREFRRHGVYILGSFIFGLPSDARDTFDTTVALAEQADLTFAQFVLLTPFPGTVDFEKWAAEENRLGTNVDGVPVTQHWLIPEDRRPKVYAAHPTMSLEDIRIGTQRAWDRFYSWPRVWARSRVVAIDARAPGIHAGLEDVPPDVREHGHGDRQRAPAAIGTVGPMARDDLSAPFHGAADARPGCSRPAPAAGSELTVSAASSRGLCDRAPLEGQTPARPAGRYSGRPRRSLRAGRDRASRLLLRRRRRRSARRACPGRA